MANPARLLHEQFSAWQGPSNTSAADIRGLPDPFTDNWVEIRRAFTHLANIEILLNEMEARRIDVTIYRRYFNAWTAAATTYPRGWLQNGESEMNPVHLEHLHTLAGQLDAHTPQIAPEALGSIDGLVAEAARLLSEDASIPADLRNHLIAILSHTQRCVKEVQLVGEYEVSRAVDELLATLGRVAHASEETSRWSAVVNNFVWPFTAGIAVELTSNPLLQQLMSGQ